MDKYRVKLIKNDTKGEFSPQYTVTYKAKNEEAEAGYYILSRLKADNDIVIELNSSMIFSANVNTEKLVMDFLEEIRSMNLEYSLRQSTVPQKPSIFSFLSGNTKNTVLYEILAYVPDRVWKEKFSKDNIPLHGARYFIPHESEDAKELIDKMGKMTDMEKRQYFKLVLFHAAMIGQMGIETTQLNDTEIKALLGI